MDNSISLCLFISLSMLIYKSFYFGINIQDELLIKKSRSFYKKNKSKNFIVRYLYLNFKNYINRFNFYGNLLFPLFAILNIIMFLISICTNYSLLDLIYEKMLIVFVFFLLIAFWGIIVRGFRESWKKYGFNNKISLIIAGLLIIFLMIYKCL